MSALPHHPLDAGYTGRFAPSPSGPLHAGSLVAAVASYLDARAHDGRWLVRIEDVDETRTVAGAAESILHSLERFGMRADGPVLWQSRRKARYQAAFDALAGAAYPCGCTRREIADSSMGTASDGAAVYPGTCRDGLLPGRHARTLRVRVPDAMEPVQFNDRLLGPVSQRLATDVGDFVLKRADGFWAYQLAVVVDDADQGVTHVVRGADLLDSTPRQIYLQRLLGLPQPHYMHVPVLRNAAGEKLSKQTGAAALDLTQPLPQLHATAEFLGLDVASDGTTEGFWRRAIAAWRQRFG